VTAVPINSLGFNSTFDDPNGLVNRGGPLDLNREWQFKAVGTYLAPLGFSFSGFFQYNAGVPLYRTYTVSLVQGYVTVDSATCPEGHRSSRAGPDPRQGTPPLPQRAQIVAYR